MRCGAGVLTILADVSSILIHILEFPQCLDDIEVLSRPGDDELRTLMQTVIENFEGFENVAPILALVVESLIDNVHNIIKVVRSAAYQSNVVRTSHHCAVSRDAPYVLKVI